MTSLAAPIVSPCEREKVGAVVKEVFDFDVGDRMLQAVFDDTSGVGQIADLKLAARTLNFLANQNINAAMNELNGTAAELYHAAHILNMRPNDETHQMMFEKAVAPLVPVAEEARDAQDIARLVEIGEARFADASKRISAAMYKMLERFLTVVQSPDYPAAVTAVMDLTEAAVTAMARFGVGRSPIKLFNLKKFAQALEDATENVEKFIAALERVACLELERDSRPAYTIEAGHPLYEHVAHFVRQSKANGESTSSGGVDGGLVLTLGSMALYVTATQFYQRRTCLSLLGTVGLTIFLLVEAWAQFYRSYRSEIEIAVVTARTVGGLQPYTPANVGNVTLVEDFVFGTDFRYETPSGTRRAHIEPYFVSYRQQFVKEAISWIANATFAGADGGGGPSTLSQTLLYGAGAVVFLIIMQLISQNYSRLLAGALRLGTRQLNAPDFAMLPAAPQRYGQLAAPSTGSLLTASIAPSATRDTGLVLVEVPQSPPPTRGRRTPPRAGLRIGGRNVRDDDDTSPPPPVRRGTRGGGDAARSRSPGRN